MSEHEPGPGSGASAPEAPGPGDVEEERAGPAPERTRSGARRRDPVWDPPTIVYVPKGSAGAEEASARPASGALGDSDRPPSGGEPTMRSGAGGAGPDDPTVPVPGKALGGPDDPTIKRPAPEEDPTVKAPPKTPRVPRADEDEEEEEPRDIKGVARWVLRKHGSKLWWLHTAYALGLGAFVVTFAQKGFQHARWLAITISVAWLVVVLFFRVFGTGARQDFATAWRGARVRFLVMTYVLKNLYQGMLFFLLPFYWKSATLDAPNRWFVLLLGGCAVLSTLDLVFDRVLMRWKILASFFYGLTLFACLNLVIPALLPNTRTLWTVLSAAGITVLGFSTLHIPLDAFRHKAAVPLLVTAVAAGVGLSYACRAMIPPVPMHLSSAAVGPAILPDGRLAMEVKALHASVIEQLLAVTDVMVPGGKGDRLHHVWRREDKEIYRAPEETSRVEGPEGAVRLKSSLTGRNLPARLVGRWTVDVETEDGQLVGRVSFEVKE
jgi:hypothetical protein